jgi:hypothetical protein
LGRARRQYALSNHRWREFDFDIAFARLLFSTPTMAYRIEYSPDAEDHLCALTARQRVIVLNAVD